MVEPLAILPFCLYLRVLHLFLLLQYRFALKQRAHELFQLKQVALNEIEIYVVEVVHRFCRTDEYLALGSGGVQSIEARCNVVEHIVVLENELLAFEQRIGAFLVGIARYQRIDSPDATLEIVYIYFAIGLLGEIVVHIGATMIYGIATCKIAIG